ncbi:MAG: serine protease [Acidobacteriaceae bacterium]
MLKLAGMTPAFTMAVVTIVSTSNLCAQKGISLSPQQIYSKSRESVVTIYTFDANKAPLSQGSGFLVAKNRIITNYHVLAGSSSGSVIFDDGTVAPIRSVVAGSQPNDLAIVDAATGARQPLPLAAESSIKIGETVYAIGSPRGLSASLSSGLVSAFREEEGEFRIQITAQIAPGSRNLLKFASAQRIYRGVAFLPD